MRKIHNVLAALYSCPEDVRRICYMAEVNIDGIKINTDDMEYIWYMVCNSSLRQSKYRVLLETVRDEYPLHPDIRIAVEWRGSQHFI